VDGLCATMAMGRGTLNLITIGESKIAGVGVKTHEEGFTGSLAMELSVLLGCDVRWKVVTTQVFKDIKSYPHENREKINYFLKI
jgi:hypothetical protein